MRQMKDWVTSSSQWAAKSAGKLFLAVLIVGGCAQPSPAIIPSATPTAIGVFQTPTDTPTSTATIVVPTPTAAPTVTPTVTIVIPTQAPTSTLSCEPPRDVEAGQGQTKITVLAICSSKTRSLRELLPQFEEQNPDIVVEVIEVESQEIRNKAMQGIYARAVSAYDVIEMHAPGVVEFRRLLMFDPLDSYLENASPNVFAAGDFPQALRSLFQDEYGVLWAIPIESSARLLFYNKRMFEEAGIAEPPGTWHQFHEDAAQLTNPPDKYGYVFAGQESSSILFLEHLWANGGTFLDENSRPAFNRQAGIAALQYMIDLVNEDQVVAPEALHYTPNDAMEDFMEGKAAMSIFDASALDAIEDPLQSKVVGEVAYVPIPRGSGGRGTLVNGYGMAIAADSANKDASWRLIQWAASPLVDKETTLASKRLTAVRKDTLLALEVQEAFPVAEELLIAYDEGSGFPKLVQLREIMSLLDRYILYALTQEMSAQEALDAAATKVQTILEIGEHFK
jgi:multiple sugar transport system substrate-binding protein